MKRVIFAVSMFVLAASGFGQGVPGPESVLKVGDKAYLVGPGQLISANGQFRINEVSKSGRFTVFTKTEFLGGFRKIFAQEMAGQKVDVDPKQVKQSLWVWDDKRGKALPLWQDLAVQSYADVTLFGDTGEGVMDVAVGEDTIRHYTVDLMSGEMRPIQLGGKWFMSRVDKARKRVIFLQTDNTARAATAAGDVPAPPDTASRKFVLWSADHGLAALPAPPQGRWFRDFLPDGSGILTTALPGSSAQTVDEHIASMMVLDLNSMQYRPARKSDNPMKELADVSGFSAMGHRTTVGTLDYTEKGKTTSSATIEGGMDHPEVSPDGSKIVFESNQSLFIADIVAVDKKKLDEMMIAAKRAALLSNAKQVGLAIIIAMSDNKDNFPGRDGFNNTIMPYLKNASLLSGFVYSYNGPANAADLKVPATTEMGYISGPGGRAVVYTDGHAKWVQDP